MQGRQQIVRENGIDRKEQVLLTDRRVLHELQKQDQEREQRHQYEES